MSKRYNPGKYEQLVFGAAPVIINPDSTATNAFFGTTTITSQAANRHWLPAGAVKSDSVKLFCIEPLTVWATTSEGAVMPQWVITSTMVGSGFQVGTTGSWACPTSYRIHWIVFNR